MLGTKGLSYLFATILNIKNTILRNGKSALGEFSYFVFLSLMPVWLGALIQYLYGRSIGSYLFGYLSSGQALLISSTAVGPLLYFLTREYGKTADGATRRFPYSSALSLSIIITCMVSACVLGVIDDSSGGATVLPSSLSAVSIVVAIAATFVWFAVALLKNDVEQGSAKIMRQDEEDFVKDYGGN